MIRIVAVVSALAFVVPGAAQAADPAAATITSCGSAGMTVAGKVRLSRSGARKVRGAVLQMRFQALSLFGLPRTGQWRSIGKKKSASNQETFSGLGAENWLGLLEWRYKKGRKTVASGLARSEPLKIGRSKGRANCVIAEGAKPADTTPPATFISPADESWHHAPANVNLWATDDFSGVKSVTYSVDGGPATSIANGGTFQIAAEGPHTVDWSATDVAGNVTTRSAVVRVDANPPTKPVITGPRSVTANGTDPTIQWQPSGDSGAGILGYYVAIKRADGSVAAAQGVGPDATSAKPGALPDGDYTATVLAVDKTVDPAWTTESDPYHFRVDSTPEVTSTTPANGSIVSAKLETFTVNFDRRADPASIPGASVTLHNVDTNSDVTTTAGCSSGTACTALVVDPQPSTLPEGRYTLSVSGVKTEEGTPFAAFTGRYSVAFPNADGASRSAASKSDLLGCTDGTDGATVAQTYNLGASANDESGVLDFDWSASGPWTLEVLIGGSAVASTPPDSSGGSGHMHLGPFNLKQGALQIKLTVRCPAPSSADITNIVGGRVP